MPKVVGDLFDRTIRVQMPPTLEICRRDRSRSGARTHRRSPFGSRGAPPLRPTRRTCLRDPPSRHRAPTRSRRSGAHFAHHPVSRFVRDALEQRIAGRQRRLRIDAEQLGVVVNHLFEVRNHPVLIDRVARKAATELIVNAAFGHARQRQRRHVQRMQIRFIGAGGRAPLTQQKREIHRMRKLRRDAEAAELGIEIFREQFARALPSGPMSVRVCAAAGGGSSWRTPLGAPPLLANIVCARAVELINSSQ